jgi:RNA-binding protein
LRLPPAFSVAESKPTVMPLSSKERAELRAEAHHLSAAVHVGHQGLTPTLIQALDDALRTRELVKVQLNKNADESPKTLATRLGAKVRADIVQVIGRTATFYRENPELERKPGAPPPWRA